LKRWEIENYLYDKAVLQSYCSANGLTFDEEAYDSLVKDVDNQDLKSETGRIKNICGIVGSVSQDNFKVTLSRYLTQDMEAYSELEACIFRRS
jgi:hypothetical protein